MATPGLRLAGRIAPLALSESAVAGPDSDSAELRLLILEQAKGAGVGHIGSALSIADIVDVLYGGVLRGVGSEDPDRDILVLAKGHAAMALYAALHMRGLIDKPTLLGYCSDGSLLGVHPEHQLPGVEFSTGSLGQGLSLGVGSALAQRMRGSSARTYVIVSDAELNEGSTWEAIMFAAQHQLHNLTVVLDNNGQQALAPTREVIDLGDVAGKLQSFGWDVAEVDGHSRMELRAALSAPSGTRPRIVIARTVAGKGVSFMEGKIAWHYLPMTDGQYAEAVAEISSAGAAR